MNDFVMVPELRFSDFSTDWSKDVLGNKTEWKSGGTPSKQENKFWNGDIPWISASSMYSDFIEESKLSITEAGLRNGSRLAKKGSLLILVRGSMLYNRVPIGVVVRDVAFNQDVKALVPDDSLGFEFLFYWLKATEHKLLSMVVGTGIGAGKLDTPELKALDVFFPNKEEQQKIADFLGSVDNKLNKLRRKHELLETWKRGLMQKNFSQQLRFTQDDGTAFSDWVDLTLGEICEVKSSKRVHQKDWTTSGIPFYRAREIVKMQVGEPLKDPIFISEEKFKEIKSSYSVPKVGDILVTGVGTIGIPFIVNNNVPFYFKDGNLLWFSNIDADSRWIYLCILDPKIMVNIHNEAGSTVQTFTIEQAKKLSLPMPCVDEQKKIANFVSSVDKKIEAVTNKITQAETFKKGLLQKMFV